MTTPKAAPASSAGISDEAVLGKTGRRKDEWFAILDQTGAQQFAHPAIVAILSEHGVASWWRQLVTVAALLGALYEAFANARRRACWLPKAGLAERNATPLKRIRYTGPAGHGAV